VTGLQLDVETEMENLPTPIEGAADVAKLTIGIASAIAGVFLPGAGVIGPIANFAIEKYIRRPEKILIDELKGGNLGVLTNEQVGAFIPMAYRFFEAAKEGEYEHNLRILAEFLKNELKADAPDEPSFARMARRIEGLTRDQLKVVALIDVALSDFSKLPSDASERFVGRPFVAAASLAKHQNNRDNFDHLTLQNALADLAGRGLLITDGATRLDKHEEYYFESSSFRELIEKAKNALDKTTSQDE
jgi:hypothetical protein